MCLFWPAIGSNPAPRGERLNVMAALLSSGQVSQPLVIVLDNASIHRAKAIRPALAMLEEQGVKFEFLSAYSPELNRIETMWRLMKHRWIAVKRRTKEELERAVEHVFEHFGNQFKMKF